MNTYIKSITIFVFFFTGILSASASHIVGGDFQIFWSGRGSQYNVYMNMYFDNLHANSGLINQDLTIWARVYEKGTNVYMAKIQLDRQSKNLINNTNNYCVDPGIVETRLLFYTGKLMMNNMNSPNGYYMVWEQCCRNKEAKNLLSPNSQQQTFYIEIPPDSYKNTSPTFPVFQNQFYCANTMNTFDFSGFDYDGDSLTYKLITPLRITTNVTTGSAPYDSITWASGYSGSNQIPGNPKLAIDLHSGVMTFAPPYTGPDQSTYTFGVVVEEFRNGVRIGRVIRDFQFVVVNCSFNEKPVISFSDTSIKSEDTISVTLKSGGCFSYYITDQDASVRGKNENITMLSVKTTYPFDAISAIPANVALTPQSDTMFSSFCFNTCGKLEITEDTYYPFTFVIHDNWCPTKFDTLIFTLKVEASNNAIPQVTIDPATDPKTVKIDSLLTFTVKGTDADAADKLSIQMYDAASGMQFPNPRDSSSTISGPFSWVPSCDAREQGTFRVYFVIRDNSCISSHADTVYQTIHVEENMVSFEHLYYPNLVTPNNDQLNDVYEIRGIPPGNCTHFFKKIEVYNVWGAKVFTSSDRHFKWYPTVSDGLYFYVVDFNEDTKTGWIEVLAGSK